MDDLALLAIQVRDANEHLYGLAEGCGVIRMKARQRPALRTNVARSSARVVYETTRDLTFDAARVLFVSLTLQAGVMELAPLAAGTGAFLLATVVRVVLVKLGGEQ